MPCDLDRGVLLRLAFQTDMRLNYRTSTHVVQEVINKGLQVARNEQRIQASMVQWVLRCDDPSNGHILTVVEPEGEVDAATLPPGVDVGRQVAYAHMSHRGEVLEASGQDTGTSYCFPEGPVRTGDSWEVATRARYPGVSEPVTGKNTFVVVGSEEVEGVECVKIEMRSSEQTFEMPLPDGQVARVMVTTRGTLYFSPDEQVLRRMELVTRSAPKIGDVTFETTTTVEQQLMGIELPEG